jgi:hypothetical protein
MQLFRELNAEEEAEFRKWARDNYKPMSEIQGIWHPVVQDECTKINKEMFLPVDIKEGDIVYLNDGFTEEKAVYIGVYDDEYLKVVCEDGREVRVRNDFVFIKPFGGGWINEK